MKTDKLFVVISFFVLAGIMHPVQAQTTESQGEWSVTMGFDAVSGYWYQGTKFADASLQPTVYFDYEKDDFSLSMGAWGTKSLSSPHYDELDLIIGASWKQFSVTLTDFYDFAYNFCPYNEGHTLDLGLSYTLSESIPLTLSCNGLVLGNRYGDDLPLYLQLSYDFSIWKIDCSAQVGGVPMKSYYYDIEQADIVNLGIQAGYEWEINQFSFPVSLQYNYNPSHNEHFFGGGIGFYFSTGL